MGRNLKKRKILYISGTRADYGLMRQTLFSIRRHPGLEIEVIATGMHLMPKFGMTVNEIKKDKFKIHEIKAVYKRDNKESMPNFIGEFVLKFTKAVKKIKPSIILILGDRAEMLAAAAVGAYLTIPVAHSHGGDVTTTVDEFARHAITKLAHIHFAATKKSAERIIKMGEDPWRVFIVGAPGLDSILGRNEELLSKEELEKRYALDLAKPILLVLQHPVTTKVEDASEQMRKTMEAIKELGYQAIVVYPNADAGGRKMIEVIEQYRKYPFLQIYKNLPSVDYLSLMKVASVMVGNSSSGIIESTPFQLPVVNIGDREKKREGAENIIGVDYDKEQIKKAIIRAISDKRFRKIIEKSKSPYGDGRAGERIADILAKIKTNKKLLQKQITY